ncbi:hypothetical protein MMC13_005383 [Lambiella insularis]|nr:hypothetical protein [Lambiella insularis]
MSSTPSPTASCTTASAPSTSRRPPRKSTLTQQQKNQKRQRATQDQLLELENEFVRNPTPTAGVRERIAAEINMTERSVQIWFQNRRAKIKLIAKKSIETGEDCDKVPDSYRNYLLNQAQETGKPLSRHNWPNDPRMPPGSATVMYAAENGAPQKLVIQHLTCKSLSIGTWRRVGQNAMDLVVFYSLGDKPCLTYYINNDAAGYKIEFPFSHIKHISLEGGPQPDEASPRVAGLVVELNRPPNFFMDSNQSGGFYQCGDFTEEQQASRVLTHHLGGDPRVLSGQLAKLTLLESFKNRHNPYMDISAVAVSAPVSPVGARPVSQPNAMPPPPLNISRDHFAGMSMTGMNLNPPMRGHKRTRSRSVPAALDIHAFRQHNTPSFHVQHPSTSSIANDWSMFQSTPGYHLTPMNPDLRIDTSTGYGMDFRQYPMSAATTTSPSEFASPSFFASGGQMDHMPVANPPNGYGLPFLSPMPEHSHMVHHSPSPLSAMSHGDPVIADQSPQMSNLHRSASADFLTMSHDHQTGLLDESAMLSDMYSKQNLNLPIRSAEMDDSALDMQMHSQSAAEEFDMQTMVNFGTIDPSNLNSGNVGM